MTPAAGATHRRPAAPADTPSWPSLADSSDVILGGDPPPPIGAEGTWPPGLAPTSVGSGILSIVRRAHEVEAPSRRRSLLIFLAAGIAAVVGAVGVYMALQ
jgi:hypothetical protein